MSEYIYCSDGKPLANEHGEISLAREEIVRCHDCLRQANCPFIYEYGYYQNGFCAWG